MIIKILVICFAAAVALESTDSSSDSERKQLSDALQSLRKQLPALLQKRDSLIGVDSNTDGSKTSNLYARVNGFLKQRYDSDDHGGGSGEIKHEMINMLDTIFMIMKHQGTIKKKGKPVWNLVDRAFEFLADYVRRKEIHETVSGECPYSYDDSGNLCLATDLNAVGLSWHEARLYCQIVKGGDLAIFQDANEFQDIVRYARKSDPYYKTSFWIGATEEKEKGEWKFINGERVPSGSPFWGRKKIYGKQNPSGNENSDYAILDGKDYHYLADIANPKETKNPRGEGEEEEEEEREDELFISKYHKSKTVVPMCQYFKGRGHNSHHGFHHDQGFYHDDPQPIMKYLTSILTLNKGLYEDIEHHGHESNLHHGYGDDH